MRASAVGTLTLITLSALAGCSDSKSITSPAATTGPAASTLVLASPTTVNVVTRDVPQATSETASKWIGIFGGTITLPNSGLRVTIPLLALTSTKLITVRSVPGNQVAYEFEPHGTRFLLPVTVTQNLAGTSASTGGLLPPLLYAGYFQNVSDLNLLDATATVTELLSTSLSSITGTATFSITHFSGYLIAAGLSDPSEGEGSQ